VTARAQGAGSTNNEAITSLRATMSFIRCRAGRRLAAMISRRGPTGAPGVPDMASPPGDSWPHGNPGGQQLAPAVLLV